MRRRWFFLLFLLFLYSLSWLRTRPRRSIAQTPFVDDLSLSVVVPVLPTTLDDLDDLLAPFMVSSSIVYEIAVCCPQSLATEVHRKLRLVLQNVTHAHPKVTLYPWSSLMHHHQASLQLAAQVKTPWVLILDEHGFKDTVGCDREYLIHPRAVPMPVGPRGFGLNQSQLSLSDRIQSAVFLVPPFVAPSVLLAGAPLATPLWPALGNYVAKSTLTSSGGIVIGTKILGTTCKLSMESDFTLPEEHSGDHSDASVLVEPGFLSVSVNGFFVLAFPEEEDLLNFVPAACNLLGQGYAVLAYLYDTTVETQLSGVVSERKRNCTIPYFRRSNEFPTLSDWLNSLRSTPDVVIGLDHLDSVSVTFALILQEPPFHNTTLIRLPRFQLPYTEWIGTLSLQELLSSSFLSHRLTLHYLWHADWNVPEVTFAVITNNRSHSLRRLLGSIQRTLFYGDKVNMRINMDQTSDTDTMQVVHDFEWTHGDMLLHHRVIHGGLLPAVVESWYPDCNDSYGLLLEDDVELSPLSYAWIKMTLLRYKYGNPSPSSSRLFGISLYQQKVIELRPTGRQPFDARTLFQSASLAEPSTPYLSQIPCSWGALYFPSPWREFHDYLSLRLSQPTLPIYKTIVPGVRSSRWAKSWKKYFIELVYLRGYVMLYPNYDNFVSFSTNHLEVGSHVKDEPSEVYEQKKRWFSLPLMHLAGASAAAVHDDPGLLDLPGGSLPDWAQLPVLDLLGELSSMEVIYKRGHERRSECEMTMSVDIVPSLPLSVRDLLCHVPVF